MRKPKEARLYEVATIGSGTTPSRALQHRYFSSEGTPWVKTGDLNNSEITRTEECLTAAALEETSIKVFPAGTVLVAMYGGLRQIGRTGLLTTPAAVNQALSAVELDRSQVDPRYVLQFLNGHVEYWRRIAASSRKDPNITRLDVEQFPILLPSLTEQRRIAEILCAWDAAIEKMVQLIAAKQLMFKSRREDLAWSLCTNRAVQLSGLLVQSSYRVGPGRNLRVFSVTKDGLVPQDEHFNKRISNEDVSRHMLVEQGDFAFSGLNFWLGSVDVSLEPEPFCISPDYKVFKIGQGVVPGFFRHLVRTDRFRQILRRCAIERASVVRKNFDRETFLASEIPLPDRRRQEAVLNVLSAAEHELFLLHRQLDVLAKQKRGLMHKLLTGEWPVKILESQEAAE